MDIRVRLVFVDEVGRHVQRRRGFSSCWYLVPREVKLVGDLAHALLLEFGLRKRCPKGLELRLEELPLLATQSIRVVRDNDTVVVHCPPLESEDNGTDTSSSENEVETPKLKKRKLPVKKTDKQPSKKAKAVKGPQILRAYGIKPHSMKLQKGKVESSSSSSSSSSSDSSSSDSSSSSSDDSSSDSSSSSSDSEGPRNKCLQKKSTTPVATTNKQQSVKPTGPDSVKTSNGVGGKAKVSESNGKGPRRRRRRLRQRNGGRTRNTKQTEIADNAASQSSANDIVPNEQEQSVAASKQTNQGSRSEREVQHTVADSRRIPRTNGHVLFDEETGDRVVSMTISNNLADRQSQAPELAKYGPSSLGKQRLGDPRDTWHQSSSTAWTDRNQESNDDSSAFKRNGKGKCEERWKRPYEIVASVLDKGAEKSSGNNSPSLDLTKALASYPTGSAETSSFEPKDVIAFKTLTLCLETWQPVLSDWNCGQVQSVDENSIEVSSWTLRANGDSVDFCEVQSGEQCAVQKSELSELRFLSGPSYNLLEQTTT